MILDPCLPAWLFLALPYILIRVLPWNGSTPNHPLTKPLPTLCLHHGTRP
jgi:hypothetical protein